MVQKTKSKVAKGAKTKTAVVKPVKIAKKDEEIPEEPIKKPLKKTKKVVPEPVQEESSEEESEEEEGEEMEIQNGQGAEVDDDDDSDEEMEDDDEDDEEDDDDDDDDDDEEEEEENVKTLAKGKKTQQAKVQQEEEDDDEEDDEDDDEDDDDDDDEDEDDDEEEAPSKKSKVTPAAEDDDDDEEDDDEDEDEEEEEEEEETPPPKVGKKRKMQQKTEAPSKKAKPDADTVTICFSNLQENTDDSAFNELLEENGVEAVACRFSFNRQRAFVDVNSAHVSKALQLNQTEFNGQTITVEKDEKKKREPRQSFGRQVLDQGDREQRDRLSLFCKNLPYEATEDDVSALFEGVKEVRIGKDRETGRSRGFCFVEFESEDLKNAAYESREGKELCDRPIFIDTLGGKPRGGGRSSFGGGGGRSSFGGGRRGGRDSRGGGSGPSKTLFVRGITEDFDQAALLSGFDGAVDARIPVDRESGRNKPFGYVEFGTEAEAEKIYKMTKGGVDINGTMVTVDFARERGSGGEGRGGRGGFGRGGGRGRGNPRHSGGIQKSEGKRTTFDDDDD